MTANKFLDARELMEVVDRNNEGTLPFPAALFNTGVHNRKPR